MSDDKYRFVGMKLNRDKYMQLQLALQQDIETLLLKYKAFNTFSFAKFSDIWNDLNFSLVYVGKYRSQEFGHYTEMVYTTVKKYIVYTKTRQMQVGGLYVLYGLYYKNPLLHLVKIRLLKDEFQALQELMSAMRSKREVEPLYIFNKMIADQVFDFVRTHYVLGLETRHMKVDLDLPNNIFSTASNVISELKMETDKEIEKIERTNTEYTALLKKFMNKNNIKIATHPLKIKEELCTIIKEVVKEDAQDITEVREPVAEPSTSIADKRSLIRSKAFQHKDVVKQPAYVRQYKSKSTNSKKRGVLL